MPLFPTTFRGDSVRSLSEGEVGSLYSFLPIYKPYHIYHRRKLDWLGIICSWQMHAGCCLSHLYPLGSCKSVVWGDAPVYFQVVNLDWTTCNSLGPFFLVLLNLGTIFVLFQSSQTLPGLHDCSKIIANHFANTSASSLHTLRWILPSAVIWKHLCQLRLRANITLRLT